MLTNGGLCAEEANFPGVQHQVNYDNLKEKAAAHIDEEIERLGLADCADLIRQAIQVEFRLEAVQTDDLTVPGRSRFGGSPDLPRGFAWPRFNTAAGPAYCDFVCQINLEHIPFCYKEEQFSKGLLYVFVSNTDIDSSDIGTRLILIEDARDIELTERPNDLPHVEEWREIPPQLIKLSWGVYIDYMESHPRLAQECARAMKDLTKDEIRDRLFTLIDAGHVEKQVASLGRHRLKPANEDELERIRGTHAAMSCLRNGGLTREAFEIEMRRTSSIQYVHVISFSIFDREFYGRRGCPTSVYCDQATDTFPPTPEQCVTIFSDWDD